jgi:DNA processing protein
MAARHRHDPPAVDLTRAAGLPEEAWVAALSMLEQMGPRRLTALLDEGTPFEAWQRVRSGIVLRSVGEALGESLGDNAQRIVDRWSTDARQLDPVAVWDAHVAAGVGVTIRSSPAYPTPFADDIEPPAIVFTAGDPDAVIGARVAIVGTRDCTRYGYDIARRLGAELSEAGVSIVSGLALGIDGAAHAGALDAIGAPPIAVVGSGLDIVYPRRHAELWQRVAAAGLVLSEYPLGTAPVAWHFPARNRLIAALADVVVVVESQESGGSMITADEAERRATDVMAVPGPITSKVSAGTNRLLSENALVVRDATDVLMRLGMGDGARRKAAERRPRPSDEDRALLGQFEWQPASFDQLLLRSGLDFYDLSDALDRLCATGWVDKNGGWFERIAKPGG